MIRKELFELNEQMNSFDVEKQVHRDSEGQDTITPLTNVFFIKQLSKLKQHNGSSKSINSIQSGSSLNRNSILVENDFDTHSLHKIPEAFLSLFRSSSSRSQSKTNLSDIIYQSNNLLNESFKYSPNLNQNKKLNQEESNLNTTFNSGKQSLVHLNSNSSNASVANKTDKVFDALSNILLQQTSQNRKIYLENEFIENVKLIVKHSEMIKKKKLDKSIFMCRFITFLFFLFMLMLVCYFLKTLHSISSNIIVYNSANLTLINEQDSFHLFYSKL